MNQLNGIIKTAYKILEYSSETIALRLVIILSSVTQKEYPIRGQMNCDSQNVLWFIKNIEHVKIFIRTTLTKHPHP